METIQVGSVVAVCLSPNGGVPKYEQPTIAIVQQGVQGDYHCGPTNLHKKSGQAEANTRQITLVAREVVEALNQTLDLKLTAGSLGENILVLGLGDLSQFRRGDCLRIGRDVVLEVTDQNKPCKVLNGYHPDLVSAVKGRRGLTATVVTGGSVLPGDSCVVLD